jgi:hypothetical protein
MLNPLGMVRIQLQFKLDLVGNIDSFHVIRIRICSDMSCAELSRAEMIVIVIVTVIAAAVAVANAKCQWFLPCAVAICCYC